LVIDAGGARETGATVDLAAVAEFRSALRRFDEATDVLTRRHGLTRRRYELLLMVASAPAERPATISGLAARMSLKAHTTAELVARSERAGLVVREDDADDRRVTHVALTAEGESRLAAAVDALRPERERLLALLGDAVRRARRLAPGAF
jgi:DNA-binding MarR family transcriptional regulator